MPLTMLKDSQLSNGLDLIRRNQWLMNQDVMQMLLETGPLNNSKLKFKIELMEEVVALLQILEILENPKDLLQIKMSSFSRIRILIVLFSNQKIFGL